uniref:Uncharacterized protein n=1 Tax=Anopheles maculatus TaxID=74869 RepID=A0A182SVR3_9DIPT
MDDPSASSSGSLLYDIVYDIVSSPVNLALVGIISFLLYKISKSRQPPATLPPPPPELPRLRRDFTVAELKHYDGTQPDGRVLTAVNGNVYDVTKGKAFYGPEFCIMYTGPGLLSVGGASCNSTGRCKNHRPLSSSGLSCGRACKVEHLRQCLKPMICL